MTETRAFLRRFWARAIQTASLPCQRHFIGNFTAYLHAVVDQALDRDQGHRRRIDDHFEHRRHTSGTFPSLALCELEIDLSDELAYHPVITELNEYIADLIGINNVMLHGRCGLVYANLLRRILSRTTESSQLGMTTII